MPLDLSAGTYRRINEKINKTFNKTASVRNRRSFSHKDSDNAYSYVKLLIKFDKFVYVAD